MSEWQPIETAPTGIPLLVWINGFLMIPNVMTKEESGEWRESAYDGRVLRNSELIAYWMHLPPPPTEQTSDSNRPYLEIGAVPKSET